MKSFAFVCSAALAFLSTNNWANDLAQAPLRYLQVGSTLWVSLDLQVTQATDGAFLQNGVNYGPSSFGIDQKQPYCYLGPVVALSQPNSAWTPYTIATMNGAVLFGDDVLGSAFTTRITLADPASSNLLEIDCYAADNPAFVEMTIAQLADVFGKYMQFGNLTIAGGTNPNSQPTIPLTADFLTHHFKIVVNKDLPLKPRDGTNGSIATIENGVLSTEANYGDAFSCSFLDNPSAGNASATVIPAGTTFLVRSGDIDYAQSSNDYENRDFSIVLRLDGTSEKIIDCRNDSRTRPFDYQDFWTSTGQDWISWTITN